MKRNKYPFILCLLVLIGLPSVGWSQLSGKYTINPKLAASATNYQNWASAVTDLTGGTRSDSGPKQGPGVSSAVEITAYDTVYTGVQVSLSAITGSSATNTITFKSTSGDSTKCILKNVSKTGFGGDFVIQLNGADYITFDGLGLERTGVLTYSTVFDITSNSDYCTIKNCWLKGRKIPSNSTNGFTYGIGSVIFFTGAANNTTIKDNYLFYGYNGIYSATAASNTLIEGNTIESSGASGIYLSGQTNLVITGNTMNMNDFGPSTGHYISYGMRIETAPSMQITKNRIYMNAKNGQVVRGIMLANSTSTKAAPAVVANNWVVNSGGTGDCTGLAQYACYYMDFYYNNILITNSLKAGACYYHYSNFASGNIRLVNNVMSNIGGGYVYNFPGTNVADMNSIDYNNCYHTGKYIGSYSATDYTTFSAWQKGASRDTNSVYSDPGFTSAADLHVSNVSVNGLATPYGAVTDDIDGEKRSTTAPDIGADEFFPATLDVGIAKLDSPAAFCAGKEVVYAIFQNFGIDTVKSATIGWSVNGAKQTSYSYKGKVDPGKSSASLKLGSFTFVINTPYTFKIWTESPNGSKDGKIINDTLTITRRTGMSGTYSLGSSASSDYKSFNAAITDMTARGLCGPTIFNVEDGVYNEQITLVQLDGMGKSAPVTFQGVSKDSSKILITLASTTATGNNNAAIQLRGADYCTFKYMSFQRTGTNQFAQVVHILNQSNYNRFENCRMMGLRLATTNTDAINIWSDQGVDQYNVFKNNYIVGGNNNINFSGVSGGHENNNALLGNTFDSSFTDAVLLAFNDNLTISNNTFLHVRNLVPNSYTLSLTNCDSAHQIISNNFLDRNTMRGLECATCASNKANPMLIANNFFARKNGVAIRIDRGSNIDIYNNNIHFRGDSTGNIGIETTTQPASNISLLNNNIAMDSGAVYSINLKGHVDRTDHNNFFSRSKRLLKFNGRWYKTLAAYQNQTKLDSNSINVDPFFKSPTDLHTQNTALNGLALPLAEVTVDKDGEARSTTPDIGADEFDPQPNDAGIFLLAEPLRGACEGYVDIQVALKNFGGLDLTSTKINWILGSATVKSLNWGGKLTSQGVDTVYLGSAAFKSTDVLKLKVWTSDPNGSSDGFNPNDTLEIKQGFSPLPSVNAGKDKLICDGDSIKVGISASSFNTYEWYDLSQNKIGEGDRIYVMPSTTQKYVQMTTVKSNGCINYDTIEVVVAPKPTLAISSDQALCSGNAVSLGNSTVQTGHTYSWSSRPSGYTSSASGPTVLPTSDMTYIIEQTIDSSGCKAVDSVVVTLEDSPVSDLQGDSATCALGLSAFETTNNTGNSYAWTIFNGTIKSGDKTNTVDIEWPSSGKYSVELIETNAANCTDTSTINGEIYAVPSADFSFDGACKGDDIVFEDLSADGSSRAWDFDNGQKSKIKKPKISFNTSGTYQVKIVAKSTAGNCKDSVTKAVEVMDKPVVQFSLEETPCAGQDLGITNESINGTTFNWNFEEGISTQEEPSFAFSEAGDFDVKLIVGNGGCTDSLTKSVTVNESPEATFTKSIDKKTVSLEATDASATSYEWSFSDGNSATGKKAEHVFDVEDEWVFFTLTVTGSNGCQRSFKDSALIQADAIGILPDGLQKVSLFPNPSASNAMLEIQLDKSVRIATSIYTMQGRLLKANPSIQLTQGSQKIDLGVESLHLSAGTYMILITVDGQQSIQKVMIRN